MTAGGVDGSPSCTLSHSRMHQQEGGAVLVCLTTGGEYELEEGVRKVEECVIGAGHSIDGE